MRLSGATVLVTGAARGLGNEFVQAALDRGAAKVYAASRAPLEVEGDAVVPVRLDITDPDAVAKAALRCDDVTVLVNNAGVMHGRPVLAAPDIEAARAEMETNYFGTLAMCRAFAPVLAKNGGGAIVNMLSVVSWYAAPFNGSYCASKSAEWALTNAVRTELRAQGTLVVGVYAGFIDTDMASAVPGAKISPQDVAAQSFDGVERGAEEVLVDDHTRRTKASLPEDLTAIYPRLQAMWDAGDWSS
ncbi:MAG TPA: SDR family oxidoreductase [Pseudonocardia sp.]|jgi:NAD(P)-dependent dehydrogenase (short-subunit alcohol dehydrogenase family)|nr:SDR family oxidoreductase [Pseudonocardia sp.]